VLWWIELGLVAFEMWRAELGVSVGNEVLLCLGKLCCDGSGSAELGEPEQHRLSILDAICSK
jgi:hypothetical protein